MLIRLELVRLLQKWSDPEAREVSMPLVLTDCEIGIFESDILKSHLVATSMGFTMVVTAICPVLAMMLLEIGVNDVELVVDVLVGITNNSSKLLIGQRVLTIWCHNRFLGSFQ